MYTFLMQDWTTLRMASSQTSITQSEADWVSLQRYRDIVFWLEVRESDPGGADFLLLSYETAPAKDESLFKLMTTAPALYANYPPTVSKVLVDQNPAVPLSRWVRWRLWAAEQPPTSEWGATFRVHCAVNAVGVL